MTRRTLALAFLATLTACGEEPIGPSAPLDLQTAPSVAVGPIVLGSGITTANGRDTANRVLACSGPACPVAGLPQDAFVVPKHPAHTFPIAGTSYIVQVPDGTTIPAPGYACCTTATFENAFTLPSGASSAIISISVHADNDAIVRINGVEFGRGANFSGPPETFRTRFTPDPSGTNRLQVVLVDGGGALAVNYKATVTTTDQVPSRVVIDFESLAATGPGQTVVRSHQEDGFTLRAVRNFHSFHSGNPAFAGSAMLAPFQPRTNRVLLQRDVEVEQCAHIALFSAG